MPAKGFYTTDAFTDYAIEFIDEAVELRFDNVADAEAIEAFYRS